MRKSLLKLLLAVAAFGLSTAVYALGMGGINVTSALGQPLKADIELVSVGKSERGGLVAKLAPSDAYKSAGLEYPHGNKFKFQISEREDGGPYLQVSSEQPINEPFVSLLVELTWPSGKLLREYTFLLDPPGYVPDLPAQPEVRAVSPAGMIESAQIPVEPLEELPTWVEPISPAGTVAPAEEITPSEQASMSEQMGTPVEIMDEQEMPVEPTEVSAGEQPLQITAESDLPPVEPLPNIPEWIDVPKGSTMYELADQYKQADTSVERMLVALYRVNSDEFGGKNMNRIQAGKILRLPDENELNNVKQIEAVREIRIQTADWNAYRQKLASASKVTSQPQAVVQQVAVGKINSSVIDQAPVAKETAKEVLRLSKGEAPGDQAVAAAGGKGLAEQEKQNAAQEELIAKAKAADEEKMRLAMLEDLRKQQENLERMKAEAAALAQKSSAGIKAEDEIAVVETGKVKVEAVKPAAKPPVKAPVKPQPKAVPEPELLDQILAEPLYLAGGAALLLGLGGLGFFLVRRKKKRYEVTDTSVASTDEGEITGRLAAPVIPSPETGDFTRTVITTATATAAAPVQQAQEPENVDPLSEADLFLSFGRDAQAEEILTDALKTMPGNNQVRLKLLGIYSSRQDVDSFGAIARQLKDSGDEYAWEQAVEMGHKLEPENPLYGGRSMEDTGSATVQIPAFNSPPVSGKAPAPAPDIDFNLATQAMEVESPEQNFLDDMETTSVLSQNIASPEEESGMDFDITSTNPSMEAQPEPGADDDGGMVFDITGSHTAPSAEPEPSQSDSDLGMAFTLDFPTEQPAEKAEPEPEPASSGLAGINLNFDESPTLVETSSEGKGEQWQEVATKLDLAKAYQEMGDAEGAREILDEVLREGDAEQRQAAQGLLDQLG